MGQIKISQTSCSHCVIRKKNKMANRQKGFGMTAELNKKKDAKFDPELTSECVQWMIYVLEDGGFADDAKLLNPDIKVKEDLGHPLKDGVILCKLVNVIKAGSVAKINTGKMAFKQMENINNFLTSCEKLGCKKLDLFQTVDLHEMQNMPQVVNGIIALGRKAQTCGYEGPSLGPSESTENKREFSDEQLRAGDGIIGLQAGTNQCASQAGQNFGKTRSIVD